MKDHLGRIGIRGLCPERTMGLVGRLVQPGRDTDG